MTYVVTAGENVTEIVAKMKHILAMLQLVQLVRKIWVCASNIEEGGKAETVQGQGVELHPTSGRTGLFLKLNNKSKHVTL